jgi:hypothetical protein
VLVAAGVAFYLGAATFSQALLALGLPAERRSGPGPSCSAADDVIHRSSTGVSQHFLYRSG